MVRDKDDLRRRIALLHEAASRTTGFMRVVWQAKEDALERRLLILEAREEHNDEKVE